MVVEAGTKHPFERRAAFTPALDKPLALHELYAILPQSNAAVKNLPILYSTKTFFRLCCICNLRLAREKVWEANIIHRLRQKMQMYKILFIPFLRMIVRVVKMIMDREDKRSF